MMTAGSQARISDRKGKEAKKLDGVVAVLLRSMANLGHSRW
jgi:hypothetical protein